MVRLAVSQLPLWMTRAVSLAVAAFQLTILALALTNEDPVPPQGWPVLGCLALNLLAMALAWRWPRQGGQWVLVCAGLVGLAAARAGLATGLGLASLLTALGYAVPVAVVGALFWADGLHPANAGRPESRP